MISFTIIKLLLVNALPLNIAHQIALFADTIGFRFIIHIRKMVNWNINFILKHCQRHNGPEGWVHLSKVTYLVISQVETQILIKLHLQNLSFMFEWNCWKTKQAMARTSKILQTEDIVICVLDQSGAIISSYDFFSKNPYYMLKSTIQWICKPNFKSIAHSEKKL